MAEIPKETIEKILELMGKLSILIDAAITNAKALGASVCEETTCIPSGDRKAILADPTGAVFDLLAASEFRINELSIRA